MKILMTGADGNLGRELCKSAPNKIIPLGRDDWSHLDARFSNGIDVVIHAASDLRTPLSASPVSVLDSNVMSTARILEATKRHRIPRLIFISSCAVYGNEICTSEDVRCNPISVNGISKLLNERVIAEFCQGTAIKYTILRVFNMYGGDDHFSVFSHIARALENDSPLRLHNRGLAKRDFIHVSDVSNCILNLLRTDVPFTHLNIGTGIATPISDIIDVIRTRFPKLHIQHEDIAEAAHSHADITRLLRLVNCDFVDVKYFAKVNFLSKLSNP